MLATMWDRFLEDPWGFLLLGVGIAVVFLVVERIFRMLIRRRELEENRYPHRTANQLPRTFEANGQATAMKLADDIEDDEVIKRW